MYRLRTIVKTGSGDADGIGQVVATHRGTGDDACPVDAPDRPVDTPQMGRTRRNTWSPTVRGAVALAVTGVLAAPAMATPAAGEPAPADEPGAEPVRMARATWDTGWFQAEVYRQLIETLGYSVESVTTMDNEDFYRRAVAGEVDLWVNGWFPLHDSIIDDVGAQDQVEVVGTQVDGGAVQGYLVDLDSAQQHGVTSLSDLSDPEVASRFDIDGDGLADLIGCSAGWGCETVVERHLDTLDLRDTVTHVQGDYPPLMDEVIERYKQGEPVLFYTWTPNWTVGELVPGEDVAWLDVPDGWPPDDIRAVANSAFLREHPVVRRLLEAVEIPLEDISEQNARMRGGEGAPEDIRQHAREWIVDHRGEVVEWLRAADPSQEPDLGAASSGPDPGQSGSSTNGATLTVVTRSLSPFVVYADEEYTGFSVELWSHVAERIGVDYEIQQVNSLAKQLDDVQRGAADVALGGLDISSERARELALSQPTLRSGLQIMVPVQRDSGIGSTLARVVSSDLVSWILWFVAIFGLILVVVGHVIWLLERRRNPDIPTTYPRGIAESIWWAVVAVTPFGAGNNTPSRNIGRVFAVGWILAGYFLLAYFTASITSTMAVDEIRGDIRGPGDLSGHRVGTVAETPGAEQLATLGVGPVLFADIDEAYDALREGELDAVVYDAPVLQYDAARNGAGDLGVVGPVFAEFSYGIGATHDSDLRDRVDVALLELVESGVYDTVYERWFGSR